MQFYGEYQHTVDAKGRVSLPAKFRKALPEEVVIVPSYNNALSVFSEEAFETWVNSFFPPKEDGTSGFDPRNARHVSLRRNLYAKADGVPVDSAGRVTISAAKRRDSDIEKDVCIIGAGDHVEIWSAASYEESTADFSLDDFLI